MSCSLSTILLLLQRLCADDCCCFDTRNWEVPSDATCSNYEGCLLVYAVDNDDEGNSGTAVETHAPESQQYENRMSFVSMHSSSDAARRNVTQ